MLTAAICPETDEDAFKIFVFALASCVPRVVEAARTLELVVCIWPESELEASVTSDKVAREPEESDALVRLRVP